jgi:hypothetical protein
MFSSKKTREAEVRAAGANPTLGGIAAGSRRPTQHSSGRGPDAKQEVESHPTKLVGPEYSRLRGAGSLAVTTHGVINARTHDSEGRSHT